MFSPVLLWDHFGDITGGRMPRTRTLGLVCALLSLGLAPAPALARGPIVALFGMEDRGEVLEQAVRDNLIEYLAARLTEGGFQVVPLDQVRERIRSLRLESVKACYDQNCQIELGRELAAQKTLATKILRIGKSCQVTAVLYDLKLAATESAATEEAVCEIDPLMEAVKKIATRLCAPLAAAELKADEGLAEFEELAKKVASERAAKKRMEQAWQLVAGIAKDDQVQKAKRVEALQKFLAAFPKDGPYYAEAERLLRELASSALLIKTNPDGAEIRVAGELIGRAPLTREFRPGQHEISASLAGHREARVTVSTEPERNGEVILTLEPLPPPPPIAPVPVPPPAEAAPGPEAAAGAPARPMHPLEVWGHVSLWTGVACLALGGVGLGVGLGYSADFEDGDLAAEDKARSMTGLMWAGLALGAVLTATGGILWGLAPDEPAAVVAPSLAPTADGQGLGLSLGGRW